MIQPFKEQLIKIMRANCHSLHHGSNHEVFGLENAADEVVKIISFNPPVIGSLPHIHKAGKVDIDECGICGHDIRHEIHAQL